MTLKQFLADVRTYPTRAHVKHPGFRELYVRRTRRFLGGQLCSPVLDLASMEAKTPGKGAFTKLIRDLRAQHPELYLFVECVLNPRLIGKLQELGFTRCDSGESICFYLPPVKDTP